MTKIAAVYFDLGGVVELDFSGTNKWVEMIEAMGVTHENYVKFMDLWTEVAERVCVDYDVDDLIPRLKSEVGLELPAGFSFLMEFVNRFQANPYIMPVLEQAHSLGKVGLLTNMYPRMFQKICEKAGLIPEFPWDVIIDSSVVRMQKPDPKIYELAQTQIAVPASAILFVDNSLDNLQTAKNLGWQTFLYDPREPEHSSQELLAILKKTNK